ncbi:uncharacterized protein [Macrobrachium rosenbergii]|uniref:uncharacterized protein n=1 Tax=Macrobrachium rosenbergii TaxID=79674 RepID=UPI0034D39411
MNRYFLLLLLVSVCGFQSVASEKDQNEVAKEKAEDELKDSQKNLMDEKEEEEEEEEDEEEEEVDNMEAKGLSANLPFHPVNDVSSPLLQEFLVRSRRPSCSDRKCLRWYQGYWAAQCNGDNYRAVAYCAKTGKWCCARCQPKKWCTDRGGFCSMKCPRGHGSYKNGCFGKWRCCIPW